MIIKHKTIIGVGNGLRVTQQQMRILLRCNTDLTCDFRLFDSLVSISPLVNSPKGSFNPPLSLDEEMGFFHNSSSDDMLTSLNSRTSPCLPMKTRKMKPLIPLFDSLPNDSPVGQSDSPVAQSSLPLGHRRQMSTFTSVNQMPSLSPPTNLPPVIEISRSSSLISINSYASAHSN